MLSKLYIVLDIVFLIISMYLFFIKKDIILGTAALLIAVAFGLAFTFSRSVNRLPEDRTTEKE